VAGSVGPLLEDNNLILTCEVRGGKFMEFKEKLKRKFLTKSLLKHLRKCDRGKLLYDLYTKKGRKE
jgi:hypothetical protein